VNGRATGSVEERGRAQSAYRRLFADRQLLNLYLIGLLARVPMGMVVLLAVLVVAQGRDGFGVAGALSGALAVGFGVISPFRARLVDRRGARAVLVTSGVAHASAVIALWPLVGLGVPAVGLVAVGVVIGATLPPTGAVMRTVWSVLLQDEERRHAAHSAESLAVQSTLLIGPVLVSAALVTIGAGWGLVCSAVLTLVTSLMLGLSPRLAAAMPPHAAGPAAGQSVVARLVGPLRVRGLLLVLPSGFWLFAAVSSVELTAAAQTQAASAGWVVGWLLASFGVGGLLGGLVWGWRVWPGRLTAQTMVLLASLTATLAVLLVPLPLLAVGGLLFLAGATFPPAMTAQFSALDAVMPREVLTESFGWLNAARQAGNAAAGGAAGLAIEAYGPHGGWVVAVVSAVAATATAAVLPASAGPPQSAEAMGESQ
jgi:predicted MFS family arabinose efflux permease